MIMLITGLLYLSAWLWLVRQAWQRQSIQNSTIQSLLAIGLCFHFLSAYQYMVHEKTLDVGFYKAALLFFAVSHLIVLLSSLRKPVVSLFILILPLTIVSLITTHLFASSQQPIMLQPALSVHIILSIIAYSLLTIASAQALLLTYQNHQLKKKQLRGIIGILPPLQTMDALLFEFIWAGQILLTLAIATGVIFIEDIFQQKLSHKTLFSFVSWGIYATLLWGRRAYGWRGASAVKWTLCGFCALILAYFGSKLVLELIQTTS